MSTLDDHITIVGSCYFQPIADLVEKLVSKPMPQQGLVSAGRDENGYSNALIILLITMLESYAARLHFKRNDVEDGKKTIPKLLATYFPDLPTYEALLDIFMLRNLIAHNHVWHLDTSQGEEVRTISTPQQLGFATKKDYRELIDISSRKTIRLNMPADPSCVNRTHVKKVFETVWETLEFMGKKNYDHTPLAGRQIRFKGNRRQLESLIAELSPP